jgi:DNA repair exonuclease SbcCD ATPase subunit
VSLRGTTEVRLREAMERLLAGQPTASAGDLTISGWAKEAGVHRATPYRSPALLAEFLDRVEDNRRLEGNDLERLQSRLKTLESEIERLRNIRSERERSLETHNRALANQLNAAIVELERLQRQLSPDSRAVRLI